MKYKNYHGRRVPVAHTFACFQNKGYQGIDVSLETSLYEYGLIWGINKDCGEDEYHFVYYVGCFDWEDL